MKASRFFNVLATMILGAAFGIIAYILINGGENVIGLSWAAFFVMLTGIAIKQILNDNVYDKIEILQRKYDELKNKECNSEPDEKPETFRDRLKREHPEAVCPDFCRGCPSKYGYENHDTCMMADKMLDKKIPAENFGDPEFAYRICEACWDRKIPNDK